MRQSITIADGQVTHVLEQPERAALLEIVADTRREPVADREGLGRWALSVPYEDWLILKRKYPDLGARDGQIRTRAWQRFIQSPESYPYRMRDRI